MKKVLTQEMETYFVTNALKESRNSMCKKFGVSVSVCDRVFKKYNIIVSKDLKNKFLASALTGRTSFTNEQTKFIQENYLVIPEKTLAAILKKSSCGLRCRMRQLGLVVPPELAAKRKADGMYRKGQISVNKGKKQIEFMTFEGIEKSKNSRFKKGSVSKNRLLDWTETVRKDTNGNQYIFIRLPGKGPLQYKHIFVWETHFNQKIAPGMNVVFRDKNTMNCVIENLEYISDAELMSRNTIHNYPEDLKQIIKLSNKITKKIKQNEPTN